ncbi:MAG: hypothetical protein ABUS56_02325 [Acidobacteriota bacterium]
MPSTLSSHLAGLRQAFAASADKYAAHARAASVLQDMAATPTVLTEILRRHLAAPAVLNASHYPVVSCDIETNVHFGLVANCWIPLPDHGTDMTTKAIHHHGQLLLTTVTAFGPGYEHWMFTQPEAVEPEQAVYAMRLLERAPHPTGHAAFVDANIGHVPFFPPSLTITLALWSSCRPKSWKDTAKRVPALHKHSAALRRLAASVGLARALDLNIPVYYDFIPQEDGFRGMKERIEFERGPNEDYLYSLFHVLQQTGNAALARDVRDAVARGPVAHPALVEGLIHDLESGRPIAGRLSPGHYGVPYASFRAAEIERALAACAGRAPA